MTVYSLYIYQLLKYVKTNENLYLKNEDHHSYNTRKKLDMHPDAHKLNLSFNNVNVIGPTLYNKLPLSVRSYPLNKFKTVVESKLTDCAFYNVQHFLDSGLEFVHVFVLSITVQSVQWQ